MSGRLLGLVLVLGSNVNVHVLEDGPSKAVLGKHAANAFWEPCVAQLAVLARTIQMPARHEDEKQGHWKQGCKDELV